MYKKQGKYVICATSCICIECLFKDKHEIVKLVVQGRKSG